MRAEINEDILILRAENNEERQFLDRAGKEGLRNFGRGSYNTLSFPSTAGFKQFHFDSDEVNMLIFALGRADNILQNAFGSKKVDLLSRKMLSREVE